MFCGASRLWRCVTHHLSKKARSSRCDPLHSCNQRVSNLPSQGRAPWYLVPPTAWIIWYLPFLLPKLGSLRQISHKTWIHNLDYVDPPPHMLFPPIPLLPMPCSHLRSVYVYASPTLICPATVRCTPPEPNDPALSTNSVAGCLWCSNLHSGRPG